MRRPTFLSLTMLITAATVLVAQSADNPAAKPLNRDNPRHQQFLKIVAKGDAEVIFLGDSITQGWEGAGKAIWAEHFAPPEDGTLEKTIMPDLLHLSPAGYEIWAKAIKDDVIKLLK